MKNCYVGVKQHSLTHSIINYHICFILTQNWENNQNNIFSSRESKTQVSFSHPLSDLNKIS